MNEEYKHKFHKIQVRNTEAATGMLTKGGSTEVILDGKRLGGVKFFKFEVSATKIAKVMIEMYAEVEIDANIMLNESRTESANLSVNGKPVNIYTLSSYFPKFTAIKNS